MRSLFDADPFEVTLRIMLLRFVEKIIDINFPGLRNNEFLGFIDLVGKSFSKEEKKKLSSVEIPQETKNKIFLDRLEELKEEDVKTLFWSFSDKEKLLGYFKDIDYYIDYLKEVVESNPKMIALIFSKKFHLSQLYSLKIFRDFRQMAKKTKRANYFLGSETMGHGTMTSSIVLSQENRVKIVPITANAKNDRTFSFLKRESY